MDQSLDSIIAQEEAKVQLLLEEVAKRRQRIDGLKAVRQSMSQADELDLLLAKLSPQAAVPVQKPLPSPAPTAQGSLSPFAPWPIPSPAPSVPAEAPKRQVHKKGEVKNALLSCLVGGPKHISAVIEELAKLGYELTYDRTKAELWSWKSQGLVANVGKGLYLLTDKGNAAVEQHKGEAPGGAGASGATNRLWKAA